MESAEFTELFERYRGVAERFIYRKIAHVHDAEDVIGDVFTEAVKSYRSIENIERFKSWLLAIASHRCNDYYRRKSRSNDVPVEDTDVFMSKAGRVDRTSMIVRECVAEMDFTDRNMLAMFYYEDMSIREISELMAIPEGTVKSRLHHARERFREKFPFPPAAIQKKQNRKGENIMFTFPEIMPEIKIKKKDAPIPEIRCEETNGWFVIPREGKSGAWASFDYPERKRTSTAMWKTGCKVKVHGVEGIDITCNEAVCNAAENEEYDRRFAVQLTDTHIRSLMEIHFRHGVEEITTFLDENFVANWGEGENNCGIEINLKPEGLITLDDDTVNPIQISAGEYKTDSVWDLCGRYEVTVGNRTYDTALLVTLAQDGKVMTMRYIDLADKSDARTVLWRRYNSDDWALRTYKQKWSEKFPDNHNVYINGELFVHWYDCITDYVL